MTSSIRNNKSPKEPRHIVRKPTSPGVYVEDTSLIVILEGELQKEQKKNRELEENMTSLQEKYLKKEQFNRKTLNTLEEQLRGHVWNNETGVSLTASKNIQKIKAIHDDIMGRLEVVQHKTVQILIDQETEIVKEFREKFNNIEGEINIFKSTGQVKISAPEQKDFSLWKDIKNFTKNIKKAERLNERLTEKNQNLKLDKKEQANEIDGMKLQIASLKIQNFRLLQELGQSRLRLPSFSKLTGKETPLLASTQRNYSTLPIDHVKSEISLVKKQRQVVSADLCHLQESTNELKCILKKYVQDQSEKTLNSSKKLPEKAKFASLLYDATFPPRPILSRKLLNLPHNKIADIEFTMQSIQTLYENYEKDLKTNL